MNMIMCCDKQLYLDELMTESRSTIDGTTAVTVGDSDNVKHLVCYCVFSSLQFINSSQ